MEVMERDDFACRQCGEAQATLNVHHAFYRRNTSPWDYPADSLFTLCEPCHGLIQNWTEAAHRAIGRLRLDDMQRAIGYARGVWAERLDDPREKVAVESFVVAEGIGDYLGVPAEEVLLAVLPALTTVAEIVRALPAGISWQALQSLRADWMSGKTLRIPQPAGGA